MRRPGDGATESEEYEPQRTRHGGCTRAARAAKGWAQPRDPLSRVRHGASDARVQSGRSWYATASEQYAPDQAVAAVLGLLGDRAQDAEPTHPQMPALRARHAARPQQCVGGSHRRACSAANPFTGHAWNGRGGETEISATATGKVQVFHPRNPRYNAMR